MNLLFGVITSSIVGSVVFLVLLLLRPITEKFFSKTWHYYCLFVPLVFLLGGTHIAMNLTGLIPNHITTVDNTSNIITPEIQVNFSNDITIPPISDINITDINTDIVSPVYVYSSHGEMDVLTTSAPYILPITPTPVETVTFITSVKIQLRTYLERAIPFIITLWGLGVIIFITLSTRKYLKYRRMVLQNALPFFTGWGHKKAATPLCGGLGAAPPLGDGNCDSNFLANKSIRDCNIPIAVSTAAHTPMLIGLIKPTIILPYMSFTKDELNMVLTHEMVHYRRKDLLVKLFMLVANAVHWFNPAVYALNRQLNTMCELSCDEKVVYEMDTLNRRFYGETILQVLKHSTSQKNLVGNIAFATNLCNSKKNFKRRLTNLMSAKKTKKSMAILAVCLGLVIAGGGFVISNIVGSVMPMPVYASETEQECELELNEYYNDFTESQEWTWSDIITGFEPGLGWNPAGTPGYHIGYVNDFTERPEWTWSDIITGFEPGLGWNPGGTPGYHMGYVNEYSGVRNISPFQNSFLWPLETHRQVTSGFGDRINPITRRQEFHTGIDIPAPTGTHIFAAYDGYVITSDFTREFGHMLVLDHGNGYSTMYGQTSRRLVHEGDFVYQGDIIALVGSTGLSTGPHLHFEIRVNNQHVDPLNYDFIRIEQQITLSDELAERIANAQATAIPTPIPTLPPSTPAPTPTPLPTTSESNIIPPPTLPPSLPSPVPTPSPSATPIPSHLLPHPGYTLTPAPIPTIPPVLPTPSPMPTPTHTPSITGTYFFDETIELRQQYLSDDIVIVFTSENGEPLDSIIHVGQIALEEGYYFHMTVTANRRGLFLGVTPPPFIDGQLNRHHWRLWRPMSTNPTGSVSANIYYYHANGYYFYVGCSSTLSFGGVAEIDIPLTEITVTLERRRIES